MRQAALDTAVAMAARYGLDPKRLRAKLRKSISWYRKPQTWTIAFHSKEWDDMIAVAESMAREETRIESAPKATRPVETAHAFVAAPRSSQTSKHHKSRKGVATEVTAFNIPALERAGFVGWHPFEMLRSCDLPLSGGVYVVVLPGAGDPTFSTKSCGGWFKNKDPSVSPAALADNWVAGAEVVYIGKADRLRRRLREFADFGAGKAAPHWGGRLIWQLPDVAGLRVAWKETPDRVPIEAKAELIALFRQVYGKPPFANDPHRLGS